MLRGTRAHMLRAPNVTLRQLARMDERLAAHLDGLAVAGEHGARLAAAALESPGRGECFVAAVRTLEDGDAQGLAHVFEVAEGSPEGRAGLVSAFGWVSPASLRGITQQLLASPSALARQVALAAFAMHRVDAGGSIAVALGDEDAAVRCQALRVIAALGRTDLLAECLQLLRRGDEACEFDAARAALLLGERHAALAGLAKSAAKEGPRQRAAVCLLLMAEPPARAHEVLKAMAGTSAGTRRLIAGAGLAGDPQYVPWLIDQMRSPRLARLAGEAFCTITGLDLSHPIRELPRPEDAGDDGEAPDEDVAVDEDDGLPWPDPDRIQAWWKAQAHRFHAGTRYFMGELPSRAHCLAILGSGLQRQRHAAALHVCLLDPASMLFNTAAPAWRQQRWLGAFGG